MPYEKHVSTLRPGDLFRDWLVYVLRDRIANKKCNVRVFKIRPASHTVCRFEFKGEGFSVVAKFYAEPIGWKRNYDPIKAMEREFHILKKVEQIIDVPRPIAIRSDFSCVLITEHIPGNNLHKFMKTENGLYDRLIAVAQILRKLHDNTKSNYHKQDEFAHFHKILDQLKLDRNVRLEFDQLLGDWWHSGTLDQSYGCRIHNDANPENYLFMGDRVYAIDFESSWDHASFVHDLGVIAAELKHYFAFHKNDGQMAEPYIGHFLWHYSRNEQEFRKITDALPFFMALGFLRMVRLGVAPDHSGYIFQEAIACLKAR